MQPPRAIIAARREACSWIADHPEIPSALVETHDGYIRVAIGTRTTHAVVAIGGGDTVRGKLSHALGWLRVIVPDGFAP